MIFILKSKIGYRYNCYYNYQRTTRTNYTINNSINNVEYNLIFFPLKKGLQKNFFYSVPLTVISIFKKEA